MTHTELVAKNQERYSKCARAMRREMLARHEGVKYGS